MSYDDKAKQEFEKDLDFVLSEVKTLLMSKNEAYGNSALDPVMCFSKLSASERLRVRMDDKISRLLRGSDAGEDTRFDMLGYLVIDRIAQNRIGRAFIEGLVKNL